MNLIESNSSDPVSPLFSKLLTFQSGRLDVLFGPMRSGKSTRLISTLGTYADVGLRVLYINHSIDDRVSNGDSVCSTHHSNYSKLSSKITAVKASSLSGIDVTGFHVVGIDEFQFFSAEAINAVKMWVQVDSKIVLCCGLDGDFLRGKFGHILDLIPFADTVEKLSARCMRCLELGLDTHVRASIVPAPFTGKLTSYRQGDCSDGSTEGTEPQIEVGVDQYISVCRYHYDQLNAPPS